MNQHPSSPPYFDRLLTELAKVGQNSATAFGQHVHWGYWSQPAEANQTAEDYRLAAEALCLRLLDSANIRDGITLLDAGCGFGGTLACLNERYSSLKLLGLNIDVQQLQRAAIQVNPQSDNTMHLILADAASLPVAEGKVDEILAVESIFHFDRPRFLSEASRVLCRGGGITLSDFIPQERAAPYIEALNLQGHTGILSSYGTIDIGWSLERYKRVAESFGLSLAKVCDVTSQTLPTYDFLRQTTSTWPQGEETDHFVQATSLLEKASRRGFLSYTLLRLEKH